MIVSLNAPAKAHLPRVPERRRAVVIGAGTAGLTTALHIGEHALLLERRSEVTATMPVAEEWIGTDSGGFSFAGAQIRVTRWDPPMLTREPAAAPRQSLRSLVPLLRGELRLGARVVRVSPAQRRLDLANGAAVVYDKLVCTLRLTKMLALFAGELPRRLSSAEGIIAWLNARDIEIVGDDSFAEGRRAAERVKEALERKFGSQQAPSATRLYKPLLVRLPPIPAER